MDYKVSYRYKSTSLLVFLLFGSSVLYSQATDTLWTRTFGGSYCEYARAFQRVSDGGFIIVGDGSNGVWLIKTNSNGDTLWTRTFSCSIYDHGASVCQTNDGGYLVLGNTSKNAYNDDAWLIRTDINGDTLWTKTIGGIFDDYVRQVRQTRDSGYIFVGYTEGYDVWLVKTNSTGDTIWTKTFGTTSLDIGIDLQQTGDGGYILTGVANSYNPGAGSVYIIKTDSSGNMMWEKIFDRVIAYNGEDIGRSIWQTFDGGYVVVGTTGTCYSCPTGDVWLIKTDPNGDTLWTRTFGGDNYDGGYSVQQTSDSGYIIVGTTHSFGAGDNDVWVIRTNSVGDTLWTRTFGGSNVDEGYGVEQIQDGSYVILGTTSSFGAGCTDVWLINLQSEVLAVDGQDGSLAITFHLSQNYPNPFNPSTIINFQLPISSWVTLKVYNLLGQEVATLVNEKKEAGRYEVEFNASRLPSGVYFYRFVSGNHIETKKLLIIR